MRTKPLHDVSEIQRVFEQTDLDAVVVLSPRSLWCLTGAARAFARRPGYRRNSCAIAFRDAEPLLVSGRFQEEPSRIFSWVRHITTYSDYLESPLARAAEVLVQRGLGSGKIGVEARGHTTVFYDDLVAGLNGAQLIPCDDVLESLWTVKQPAEIALIKENVQRLGAEISAALAASRAGETEEVIHKRILATIRRGGTASAWGTFVAGERVSDLRALSGDRPIQSGDLVRLDYALDRRNYPARVVRMGVVGTASAALRDDYRRFVGAVEQAVSAIGPGQTGEQIFETVRTALRDAGFEPAGPSFGNALGIGVNLERPVIRPGETMVTQPGMMLSVEPAATSGFKLNQVLLITDSGAERVTPDALPPLAELLTIAG